MDLIIEKFLEIVIILIAAKTGAELMRRINQPAVIGELIEGPKGKTKTPIELGDDIEDDINDDIDEELSS